ncbi:CCN family member 1-like [Polymixia lowei]
MWTVSAVVILCGTLKLVSGSCPEECQCPREAPRCAIGVGLVLDRCGCCNVCARQLNEDCSATEPCDHIKGLECNFGAGYGATKGICRAKSEGRPCEYNDKIHQNGESFRPNCKHQCTCMDGAVACVSLCPHEVTLPKLGCVKPRVVKVPGRCCEQLVCPEEGKTRGPSVQKHSRERQSENDLTNKNELISMGKGGLKSLPAFISEPIGHTLSGRRKCVSHTTAWSPCSKSCGTGLSSRVTNSNTQCKLVKETRICEVRPCSQIAFTGLKKGQKCNPIEKAGNPVKLSYAGCRSLKKFRLRYCGSCSDGHCCNPDRTQTVPVRFRCNDGEILSKNVMVIQSCKCEFNCPRSSGSSNGPPAFHRLFNDIPRKTLR